MLSIKQRKFCEYYVELGNAKKAAIKAGYSDKDAKRQGSRLLTRSDVKDYVAKLTSERKEKQLAKADEILEYFTKVMRDGGEATKYRLKAAENLAKRYGLDKSEDDKSHSEDGTAAVTFVFADTAMGSENE